MYKISLIYEFKQLKTTTNIIKKKTDAISKLMIRFKIVIHQNTRYHSKQLSNLTHLQTKPHYYKLYISIVLNILIIFISVN